jgi:micrococcal nuclease
MRKALICALLLLFVAVLTGCGVNRAQTPPPAEKPAAQSEKTAASPAPAAESAPSGEPAPAESAKAAPSKPASQPNGSTKSAVKTLPAVVTRVVDGDTVHVSLKNGREEKVRFIGVDTPESTREVEPYGKEAAAYTMKRLDGKTVYLELDTGERDKYGRLLAYVWLSPPKDDGEAQVRVKMFNAELLLAGFAQVMTVPPNVKYADLFAKLQREAREAEKGLWNPKVVALVSIS